MGKVRRCDRRCHQAKGTRCRCWCGGFFHGAGGDVNRQALQDGMTGLLEQRGFKEGETAYIEQKGIPLPVA